MQMLVYATYRANDSLMLLPMQISDYATWPTCMLLGLCYLAYVTVYAKIELCFLAYVTWTMLLGLCASPKALK